jgi:hypothetical protein
VTGTTVHIYHLLDEMRGNIEKQNTSLAECKYFSLAFEESCDNITYFTQLCVYM